MKLKVVIGRVCGGRCVSGVVEVWYRCFGCVLGVLVVFQVFQVCFRCVLGAFQMLGQVWDRCAFTN